MADQRTQHKEIPLTGKWVQDEPAAINTNFRTMKNMKYTDTHPVGISGMTAIGVVETDELDEFGFEDAFGFTGDAFGRWDTYILTQNAFHFIKSQPVESHVLAQRFSARLAISTIIDNTGVIPATNNFDDHTILTNAGTQVGYFSNAPDGKVIFCNGSDTHMWGGFESPIGAFITSTAEITAGGGATSPADYSKAAWNSKTDQANLVIISETSNIFLVGSTLPLQGVKFYVYTANDTTSTLTGKVWASDSWDALTSLSDGTAVGGVSMAQTGTFSFDSTVTTATPDFLEGYYLYWYQFELSAGDAVLYHVTVDAPFQKIKDMWDGVYRSVVRFFKYTTVLLDNTINVMTDDYSATETYTYADISSLGAYSAPNNCLEIGLSDQSTGLYFNLPPDYVNTTASTEVAIDYWNGTGYTTVGSVRDGTAEGGISLAKPGTMSWNAKGYTDECKKVVSNSLPLYFYRVRFNKTMDASVRINYVGGMTAQKELTDFKFPVFAQGRVLLCNDSSAENNKALCSAKYMPQVYNGSDSTTVFFGDEGGLTCGIEMFSQYGAALYSLILMFKKNEMWVMAGQDIAEWENNIFCVSDTIGCPAPLTLRKINLSADPGAGTNRNLAIWQGVNGIYMSDGRAPIPIHSDIADCFKRGSEWCINPGKIGDSKGEIDPESQLYYWLYCSGTSTAPDKELVYDIKRNRWFQIDRGADKNLIHITKVYDTYGNAYLYGFCSNGRMYRLNYGTTFGGNAIVRELHLGDMPLGGLGIETQVDRVRLFMVAQENTDQDVTVTHYTDTKDVGEALLMSPLKDGYRVTQPTKSTKLPGNVLHSFKMEITTDDEETGFEPLALSVAFHPLHQD